MTVAFDRPTVMYGDLARWALLHGDSLRLLKRFPAACVDVVVTDPPYGLAFHHERWDQMSELDFQRFSTDWATEAKRVLKPGGYLVAFGSPRTFHRLVAGCEDAGLEIRDQLLWLHAAGVPKGRLLEGGVSTTLNPAYEPILLARAPLAATTATANIAQLGTGGLNIDACRVRPDGQHIPGFWPTNVVLSHEPGCDQWDGCVDDCAVPYLDRVGASRHQPLSRVFYAAKAARAEREAGLKGLKHTTASIFSGKASVRPRANTHPTVKPIDLMRWLIRLTCPTGGLVLDPFAGSGSTGCAAVMEGRQFFGIEREARYVPVARARLEHWTAEALAQAASPYAAEQDTSAVTTEP